MVIKVPETRTYDPSKVAVFWKTNERYGSLSNMSSGFRLHVSGVDIRTSEALYQACRFPHRPDIQKLIISQTSPMTAKMKGKPYADQTRADWDAVRVPIMRWCLRVKLCQNPISFGAALSETLGKDIVEKKVRRADFWGAKVQESGILKGPNVLGRLLMELRDEFLAYGPPHEVKPLTIKDFFLYGRQIETITAPEYGTEMRLL